MFNTVCKRILPFSGTAFSPMALKDNADRICRHEFNILGSGSHNILYGMHAKGFEGKCFHSGWSVEKARQEVPAFFKGKHDKLFEMIDTYVPGYVPVDWQIDFKSGSRFSAGTHHKDLKYGVIEGVDAKVSADLGRLYHLVTLAKTHCAFGDNKYRNEFVAQLLDFMAFNPAEYGAAWRANMNVSIRAANIIAALDIIGHENIDDNVFAEIMENLVEHGKYIFENLEFPEEHFHPNHFIANIAGLLMVACITSGECEEAESWLQYALKTINEQIIYQTNAEGTNFEGATAYHCLVLEMLTCSLVYAARFKGCESPTEISQWLQAALSEESFLRYRKMFEAYRDIVQPDGLVPLIGDNDSGRFLYLEGGVINKRDYRFLSVIGANLFDDCGLLVDHDNSHIEYAEILLGAKIHNAAPAKPQSAAYREAGYYIMRDNAAGYAMVSCGPVGTGGKGGHAHNDKLALTLQLGGEDIFVDPGIYTYTASEYFRNSYRSVKSHNTLCVAGEEQNRWGFENQWWGVLEETRCECTEWSSSQEKDVFVGMHHAYERLPGSISHTRKITWDKKDKAIRITDNMEGSTEIPESENSFMLDPECVISYYSNKEIVIEKKDVKLSLSAEGNGEWKTEPAYYSPEYGKKTYTQRLVFRMVKGTASCNTTIKYQDQTDVPQS